MQIRFSNTRIQAGIQAGRNKPDKEGALRPGRDYTDKRYPNLLLRVGQRRTTWMHRRRRMVDGSRPGVKLGYFPELDTAAAVAKYQAEAARIARGEPAEDPHEEIQDLERRLRALKRQVEPSIELEELIEKFLAEYTPKSGRPLAPKTLKNYRHALVHHGLSGLDGKGSADEIQVEDIQQAVDEVKEESFSQALNLYKRLKTMFRWAVERRLLQKNPMDHVPSPGKCRERDRALDANELRHFWTAASELKPTAQAVLKMAILTWQRRTEIVEMSWREISEDGLWWYLPKERAKNHQANDIFLGTTARLILEQQHGRSRRFTYPAARTDKPMATSYATNICGRISRELHAAGKIRAPFKFHDLRRSAATLAAENEITRRRVVKKILNHRERDVTDIYDRSSMRPRVERALTDWDAYIRDLVGLKPGAF